MVAGGASDCSVAVPNKWLAVGWSSPITSLAPGGRTIGSGVASAIASAPDSGPPASFSDGGSGLCAGSGNTRGRGGRGGGSGGGWISAAGRGGGGGGFSAQAASTPIPTLISAG